MASFDYTRYRHPPTGVMAQALAGRRGVAEAKAQRETWAAIAGMCLAKGRGDMTAGLIEAGVSLAEATRRVEGAGRKLGTQPFRPQAPTAAVRARGKELAADLARRMGMTPKGVA